VNKVLAGLSVSFQKRWAGPLRHEHEAAWPDPGAGLVADLQVEGPLEDVESFLDRGVDMGADIEPRRHRYLEDRRMVGVIRAHLEHDVEGTAADRVPGPGLDQVAPLHLANLP
jgi:hypothetical protein